MKMKDMKMKDVCEKFDMTPDTIRYYEKVGLIGKVPRDRNGYRNFLDKNIAEIYFSNEIEKLQSTLNVLDSKINNYEELILSCERNKLSGEV